MQILFFIKGQNCCWLCNCLAGFSTINWKDDKIPFLGRTVELNSWFQTARSKIKYVRLLGLLSSKDEKLAWCLVSYESRRAAYAGAISLK